MSLSDPWVLALIAAAGVVGGVSAEWGGRASLARLYRRCDLPIPRTLRRAGKGRLGHRPGVGPIPIAAGLAGGVLLPMAVVLAGSWEGAGRGLALLLLLTVLIVDLRWTVIPPLPLHLLLWSGLGGALAGHWIGTALGPPSPAVALLGALLGGGALWLLNLTYRWLRDRDGLGGADPWLAAGLGAWVGIDWIFWALSGGAMLTLVLALFPATVDVDSPAQPGDLPLGPGLAFAGGGLLLFA